jgi:hypothetical protein
MPVLIIVIYPDPLYENHVKTNISWQRISCCWQLEIPYLHYVTCAQYEYILDVLSFVSDSPLHLKYLAIRHDYNFLSFYTSLYCCQHQNAEMKSLFISASG